MMVANSVLIGRTVRSCGDLGICVFCCRGEEGLRWTRVVCQKGSVTNVMGLSYKCRCEL
jgi:hypothetical protein